jgi:capsular polysaccharide biosynthesis protein
MYREANERHRVELAGIPTMTWTGGRQAGWHTWADRNAAGAEELASVRPVSMTSLRFAIAALRRRAWLGCAVLLAGLCLTAAVFVLAPPPHQASISILITNDPNLDAIVQMQGNVTLAESAKVAADAVKHLRLHERPSTFMHTYTVTSTTDRILVFTTNASSDAEAVRQARALAAVFRQFRATALHIQQRLGIHALNDEIAAQLKRVDILVHQLATVSSDGKKDLQKALSTANIALGSFRYTRDLYPVLTASMVQGTTILDPAAPIPPSRKHLAVIYGAAGFFASLAAGLAVIIVGAVTSNRLRRRDDVAHTLGIPVSLSVGKLRRSWPTARPIRLTGGNTHQRRIVAHLHRAVTDGGTALAVVPVDNAPVVASSVASLAVSCAQEGRRVVLADLSAGAPAARLLGTTEPGIHEVNTEGTSLTVAIPEHHDVIPIGPIRPPLPARQHRQAGKELAAACASADLLLSTVTLDSSLGADHLATWSTDIVVMVTAGRSAPAKLHATGEMIKLAGTRLTSAILIEADKSDDSLGTVRPSAGWRRPARI